MKFDDRFHDPKWCYEQFRMVRSEECQNGVEYVLFKKYCASRATKYNITEQDLTKTIIEGLSDEFASLREELLESYQGSPFLLIERMILDAARIFAAQQIDHQMKMIIRVGNPLDGQFGNSMQCLACGMGNHLYEYCHETVDYVVGSHPPSKDQPPTTRLRENAFSYGILEALNHQQSSHLIAAIASVPRVNQNSDVVGSSGLSRVIHKSMDW